MPAEPYRGAVVIRCPECGAADLAGSCALCARERARLAVFRSAFATAKTLDERAVLAAAYLSGDAPPTRPA